MRATVSDTDSARFVLTVQPSPLPVELTSLQATRADEAVQLSWATAGETNNAGFHVERRGPRTGRFRAIGFVEGHGTTDQPQQYRFRTDALEPGRHVFRLRQVDLDGATTRSDTVSVQVRLADAARLAVAPNPVRSRGTVSLHVRDEQPVTVALYDVLGRRVRTLVQGPRRGRHEVQLDVSDLSSGVYFLRLEAPGTVKTRRVTVMK